MVAQTQEEITTISNTTPEKVIKTTKTVGEPTMLEEHPAKTFEKKKTIFRTYQLIWYVLGVIEVLLGFRIVLKALGANPVSEFTSLMYNLSNPFALPFRGVLSATVSGNSVFEWSTLFAMAVYALVAYGLIELIQFVKPVTPEEVEHKVAIQ